MEKMVNTDVRHAHPDKAIRENALEYTKRVVDFAAEMDCHMMIVAPTALGKTSPLCSLEIEKNLAAEGIRKGAEYAQKAGVSLCIEPWNRYETYLINRLSQAMDLVRKIDMPNLGVMGDTFHLNIEEENMTDAITKCKEKLIHMHFADSNRKAPGKGHLDFGQILQALKDINYNGYISFELLPAYADVFYPIRNGGGREFFDEYTKSAVEYVKQIECSLT